MISLEEITRETEIKFPSRLTDKQFEDLLEYLSFHLAVYVSYTKHSEKEILNSGTARKTTVSIDYTGLMRLPDFDETSFFKSMKLSGYPTRVNGIKLTAIEDLSPLNPEFIELLVTNVRDYFQTEYKKS